MQDKIIPKFKTGDVVRDRETGIDYSIFKFDYYQLNGSPWYRAHRISDQSFEQVCEDWLILIKKHGLWSD
jgi:hypothetical protein